MLGLLIYKVWDYLNSSSIVCDDKLTDTKVIIILAIINNDIDNNKQ